MSGKAIVVLSDSLFGGAATACSELMKGLRESGRTVQRWHFSPAQKDSAADTISLDPGRKRPPLERIIKNFSPRLADTMRRTRHRQAFRGQLQQGTVRLLNCHNIHACGLDHDDLAQVPGDLPFVWTLHDCWAFKGRAFEWRNGATGQEEVICQDLPADQAMERRRRFFSSRRKLALVAPSRWMAAQAREQMGDAVRIEHIPYGVCAETYHPVPAEQAQQELGLDPKRTWIGFSSTWASSRKGTDVFMAALAMLKPSGFGVLHWGQPPAQAWPAGVEVKTMGPVSDLAQIRRLYSACGVFVCPSRADNLPNTVLESLACGVPVVGSRVGGVPDMVRPGETGWLYETDRPENCAGALERALAEKPQWPALSAKCLETARRDYSLALQARRYLDLFKELGVAD